MKERLAVFEPVVPVGKEPAVRVDFCDSEEFTFQKYMPIGAFDEVVTKMDQVLSEKNAGKDENNIETSSVRFIVYYPDDGKMQRLKDTLEVGRGNAGFISAYKMQTENKLTDENWLAYKRGQGRQAAYDFVVSVLTNIKDNVLPYLQIYCNGQERATVSVETAQTVTIDASNKKYVEKASHSESDRKAGRSTYVRGENVRVFAFQELLRKLLSYLMSFFCRDLAWLKGLNYLPGTVAICIPHVADAALPCHFKCRHRRFRRAPK